MPPNTSFASAMPRSEQVLATITEHFGSSGVPFGALLSAGARADADTAYSYSDSTSEGGEDGHSNHADPTTSTSTRSTAHSWLVAVEKVLLRPPLLLALYLLDLDQCEVVHVDDSDDDEYDDDNDEENMPSLLASSGSMDSIDSNASDHNSFMSRISGNSESSPAAVAALQLWVIDLVESVSCWL
jgi:hypothetical protein